MVTEMVQELEMEAISFRLTKDLRVAARTLGLSEIRYLVDSYYQVQEFRKRAANQVRAMSEAEEPCELTAWISTSTNHLESAIKAALDEWTDHQPHTNWAKSIYGVGPVISAGLAAHINIEIANTAGKIWRFAGLDPTIKWGKGQKRPWNARLKVLCWKMGDVFKRFSNRPECFYGQHYRKHKDRLVSKNESGGFAELAAQTLKERKKSLTENQLVSYEADKLPPGRIDLMAMRCAVKLFLSHYQHVAYRYRFGEDPPKPFAISVLGHADYIPVPNWPF